MALRNAVKDGKYRISAVDTLTQTGLKKVNEDTFIADRERKLFAIFDGADSLVPFKDKEGRTGGLLASSIAKDAFDKGGRGKGLAELAEDANVGIRKAMLAAGVDMGDKINLWDTTVAAVKVGTDSFEWLQLSDSTIIVIRDDGSYKLLVNDIDHDRYTYALVGKLAKDGIDTDVENPRARRGVEELVRENRRELNITYGAMAGEAELKFVKTGKEPLRGVKCILIISDGMFLPRKDPMKETDFGAMVKEYLKGGLVGMLSRVRELENSDPMCVKYPRTSRSDDATGIAISFEPERKA